MAQSLRYSEPYKIRTLLPGWHRMFVIQSFIKHVVARADLQSVAFRLPLSWAVFMLICQSRLGLLSLNLKSSEGLGGFEWLEP